jgi:hypothetical protein
MFHVLDVVRLIGLPQQHRLGPVVGKPVLAEEVRIAGGDDGVAGQQSGVAVVGVQPVPLPRIVPEHHVGTKLTDHSRDAAAAAGVKVAVELTVHVAQKRHGAGALAGEHRGCPALFVLASLRQRARVGIGIPRALRSVGAHEVVDRAAGVRPLGQGGAATELDIVGMGADRQGDTRRIEVARDPDE